MMYKTRKILSVAPASTVSTAVARNGLILALPYMGTALLVFICTVMRVPQFGVILGGMGALYLPLIFFRRKAKLEISMKSGDVKWQPTAGVDTDLLARSLGSLLFFAVMGTWFFMMHG